MSFEATGGFGLFYYPPTFAPLDPAVRPAVGDDGGLDLDGDPDRVVRGRGRGPAGDPHGPLVDRPAGRAVVAVRLRGQARPGRADPLPAVRDRLALARRPDPARGERSAGDGDQAPAGDHLRLGRSSPDGGRRSRQGRSCWRGLAIAATLIAGTGAWSDFATLVRQVGDPITTRAQLHARRGRLPAGALGRAGLAHPARLHGRSSSAPSSRLRGWATAEASYLVAVIASQLLSPILWDHYAMLLLLPVAYLVRRRPLVGARHPAGRPPCRSIGITPAIAYPLVLRGRARRDARGRASGRARRTPREIRVTRVVDTPPRPRRGRRAGRRRRLGAHLLAREPRLRCRPGRLLLPRRRVPPRPDVARLPARAVRRDHRRRAVLRPVRAVPGRRA